MKPPKPKTLPAERRTLITYDDAFALFKAAGLCTTMRTCRAHISANPKVCPADQLVQSYHFKRFQLGHVEALIALLSKRYPTRRRFAYVKTS
jgi:hypothetical protein